MQLELDEADAKKNDALKISTEKAARAAARRRGQIVTPGRRNVDGHSTPVGDSGIGPSSAAGSSDGTGNTGSTGATGNHSGNNDKPKFSFTRPSSVRRDGGEKKTPRRVGL